MPEAQPGQEQSMEIRPLAEMRCDRCGNKIDALPGETYTASTDGRVWHYGCKPIPATFTRPTADLGEDGDALREGIAAWDAFVAARQRMNDAKPDVVNATAAERALYDERYQADNDAERTFRSAACRFFQNGHASAVLSRSGG